MHGALCAGVGAFDGINLGCLKCFPKPTLTTHKSRQIDERNKSLPKKHKQTLSKKRKQPLLPMRRSKRIQSEQFEKSLTGMLLYSPDRIKK